MVRLEVLAEEVGIWTGWMGGVGLGWYCIMPAGGSKSTRTLYVGQSDIAVDYCLFDSNLYHTSLSISLLLHLLYVHIYIYSIIPTSYSYSKTHLFSTSMSGIRESVSAHFVKGSYVTLALRRP